MCVCLGGGPSSIFLPGSVSTGCTIPEVLPAKIYCALLHRYSAAAAAPRDGHDRNLTYAARCVFLAPIVASRTANNTIIHRRNRLTCAGIFATLGENKKWRIYYMYAWSSQRFVVLATSKSAQFTPDLTMFIPSKLSNLLLESCSGCLPPPSSYAVSIAILFCDFLHAFRFAFENRTSSGNVLQWERGRKSREGARERKRV